ncbi:hypothetical protein I6N95_17600 [Vagococcus sp. BWB3-3]|uniref:Uncharacterized protein n=1 Tax=Vagococcus allomyrinae TaxID=2794353 RepID=A0A940PDJ0_9ENTE|nr:hypothetical protein [Vagococcus allomyrinae]MBP1042835.1 hypothetical protein [Vagococcus allomyrinae]
METNNFFCATGKLDLARHTVSQEHIPTYIAGAIEEKEVELTEEVFAIMIGKEVTEEQKTLLIFINGDIKKTPVPPCQLHKLFANKRGVSNHHILRQALNFYLIKRPKYAAFVTPETTYSRFNHYVWVNLNLATKFYRKKKRADQLNHSMIDFSFGISMEIHTGIKSVRKTFYRDVIEAWTIQKNHLLGAQPLTHTKGVTNPENDYMKKKIANANKQIELNNRMGASSDKKKPIETIDISHDEFVEVLHILTKLIPLKKEGFIQDADIEDMPRNQRNLFKRLLKWKEDGYRGKSS